MVIDSHSTRRSKDDRNGHNLRKNPDIPKGESSLRRSTRGTPIKEQITLTSSAMEAPKGKASKLIDSSSMKKSESVKKRDTSPPVKRKLEVLEGEKKSSSPLRRSDRGNKNPTLPYSDSNNNAKVTASPDVKMKKLGKDKSAKDLSVEAMKTSEEAKTVERPNGRIRKTRNAHTYMALYAPQMSRGVVPGLKRAEKLSQNDKACSRGVLGDGENGAKECSEKIEEECAENDCEAGKEQSVPKSNNASVLTLSDHEKLENGEPSQENGVNASNVSLICDEVIEDLGNLLVDNATVVELQTPEVEMLADNNVVKETGIASLPSSERKKDKFVGTCTSCCKRRRLNNNTLVQEPCLCSAVPINDSPRTFRSEDGVVHARCDDSWSDALNDGNLSTLDGELLPDSSKFVEYWVPVSISNVQLEHYCAALLSNSTTLRAASSSKDIVGALHDILISTKKCCDHPYFMDKELQGFLTKDLPLVDYLGVGIKASGKLQLLNTILPEIKSQGKRVLILYQSIRHAEMLMGDILDDYLRQKFGSDSYERVEGGIVPSKKQAALQKFNDEDGGRFVFLLEKRACTSAIKLSSLDAIVIFDSDLNIKSDNRALHKLSIDWSPEPIKVFRLYTFCTLEEKVLKLASERVTLDSNVQNIGRMTCHLLLTWGASYLFSKLDEFHSGKTLSKGLSLCSDITMEKDVAGQLLDIIVRNAENSCKNSLITKVKFNEGSYSKNTPLYGQLKVKLTDEKPFHQFWNELLEGKNPRWRFLPVHSPRNRKRVNLPTKPDGEPDEVTKKQKRIVKSCSDVASPRTRPAEGSLVVSPKSIASIPFSSKNIAPTSEIPIDGSEEETNVFGLRKNLHDLLMPTILKLSELLQIPENVKTMGDIFLEYIVKNHQISTEPKSILQAFQISLIWIAASLLSYNLDREKLLDVAKQQLGFRCTEEDVLNVFTKLRPLRKTFKKSSQKFKELESKKDSSDDRVKKVQRKCEKRKMKLLRKHEEEIQVLNRIWDEEIAQIHRDNKTELVVIRAMYLNDPAKRSDMIKRVDDEVEKKLNEHERGKELRLQELKQKQLDEIIMEDKKAAGWLKHAQGNGASVSGEKQSLDLTETTVVAPSSIPITSFSEIPTIRSKSLHESSTMEKQLGKNLICGNHNSIEELVPDRIGSGAKETDEKTVNDFAGEVKSPDTSKPDGESNMDNNLRNDNNISGPDQTENCTDAAGSSRNDDIRTVPSVVTTPLVQILEGAAQDVASLPNLVPGDECPRPSVSAGILVGDAIKCENTDDLEQDAHNQLRTISYCFTLGAQEADINPPNKFSGGTKSSDASKPDRESQEDNSLRNVIYISDSEPNEDCTDAAGSSKQDGTCTVQPLARSISVKILEAPAQVIAPLPNLVAPQSESRPPVSAGALDIGATECENTCVLEQAAIKNIPNCTTSCAQELNGNVSNEFENTIALEETTAEKILVSTTSSAQEAIVNARNDFENTDTLAQAAAENIPDCITPSAQKAVVNVRNEIENTCVLEQAEVEHPSLRDPEMIEHQLPPQELPPSQNGEQSFAQFADNLLPPLRTHILDEIMNDDSIQMGIPRPADIPVSGSRTHQHLSRPSQQMHLQPQPQSSQPQVSRLDPLQYELDRLRRVAEEAIKLHEVAKQKLKAEHEKELEEVVAELRRKYEAKLKDAENDFLQKKEELDSHHTKVFMNRILADTFRAKCLELKPSTSSGIYTAKSTSFVEQLLSQHQPQRTSAVLNPSNFVPPAASPQIAGPSVPRPIPTVPNMQMRPPHTLPNITRPVGNFSTSGEIRAMAPHLRPPSSTSVPSPAQGSPGQDPRRRPLFSAVTQIRPRIPVPVPPQHNRVMQPENRGICNPVLGTPQHDRVSQPENVGIRNLVPVPPQQNRVPQAGNMGIRNTVPGLNFAGLYLSRGGAQGGDRGTIRVNPTQSRVANDVVNLSDDEL